MSEFKNIKVGLINLRLNNMFSIYQAFKEIGTKTEIIDDKVKKYNFDILVLPGDGAFKQAMKTINKNNIKNKILEFLSKKNTKLIGICLGMQLLFDKSYEYGCTKGLSLIQGEVKKLNYKNQIVPNIGWRKIKDKKSNLIKKKNFFYFIHSFYCDPLVKNEILATSLHGKFKFCAAVKKKNIIGTQFHPEKSGEDGIKLLGDICKL